MNAIKGLALQVMLLMQSPKLVVKVAQQIVLMVAEIKDSKCVINAMLAMVQKLLVLIHQIIHAVVSVQIALQILDVIQMVQENAILARLDLV
jgi:hypothetical protein